jgi:hypothetical protein
MDSDYSPMVEHPVAFPGVDTVRRLPQASGTRLPSFLLCAVDILHLVVGIRALDGEALMTTFAPNKITGPNAGGPRQFPTRTPLAARVGQF